MTERLNDETIERLVCRTVGRRPGGGLSPFFAARTTNTARLEAGERSERPRLRSVLLEIYWVVLLGSTILMFAPHVASGSGRAIVAILVPVGFGLALYGREVLSSLLRIISVLLE